MADNQDNVQVTGGDFMNLFRGLYGFFVSHKTPDSSFYLTLLTLAGFLGTTLSATASPTLIAAGTALVGIYTLGHKLADGLSGTKPPTAKETADALAAKLFTKSLDLSVRLPAPAMPSGTMLTPEQAAAVAVAAVATVQAPAAPASEDATPSSDAAAPPASGAPAAG